MSRLCFTHRFGDTTVSQAGLAHRDENGVVLTAHDASRVMAAADSASIIRLYDDLRHSTRYASPHFRELGSARRAIDRALEEGMLVAVRRVAVGGVVATPSPDVELPTTHLAEEPL